MEIKIFASYPEKLNGNIPHTDNFVNNDEIKNPDFPYLYLSGYNNILIVAIENNEVLGGIQLGYHPMGWNIPGSSLLNNTKPKWCMLGLGINEGHDGKGIETKLIEKQFEVMKEQSINFICQSGYEQEQLENIYPIYERFIADNKDITYINPKELY